LYIPHEGVFAVIKSLDYSYAQLIVTVEKVTCVQTALFLTTKICTVIKILVHSAADGKPNVDDTADIAH